MARKRFTVEQIIHHLREAEVLMNNGATTTTRSGRIAHSDTGHRRHRRSRHTASIHPPSLRRHGQIDARQASGMD